MPERKVKAKGRPWVRLARAVLALAAPLALVACLPTVTRHSAQPQVQQAPTVAVQAKARPAQPLTTLKPYGQVERVDQAGSADAGRTTLTAYADEDIWLTPELVAAETAPPAMSPLATSPQAISQPVMSPLAMSQPAMSQPAMSQPAMSPSAMSPPAMSPPAMSQPAMSLTVISPPTTSPPAMSPPATSPQAMSLTVISPPTTSPQAISLTAISPPAMSPQATSLKGTSPPAMSPPAQADSYQAALPPFTLGVINLDRLLAEHFPDRLFTAQAGERLLAAHGLTPSLKDEPDALAGERPLEATPALVAALPGPAATGQSVIDPAPSAGELTQQVKIEGWTFRSASDRTRNLLTAAYEQTGRQYKLGGLSPVPGFDAAGYTHWVFAHEGLLLPTTPAGLAVAGVAVAKEDLRPGDVLIYRNQADKAGGWHVGIYSGQGNFLHASPKAGVVTETDAFGPQYAPYFLGGRRFFDDPWAAPLSDSQKMAATSTAVKLALAELRPDDKAPRPAPKAPNPKGKKAAKK